MRRVKAALAHQASRGGGIPAGSAATEAPPTPRYLRRFVVRLGNRIVVIDVQSVDWIEAADYYASLHVGERSYLLRQTIGDLERSLDPARFFRLHRSAIVNLDRVREMAPHAKGEYAVVLKDGTSLRLGRGRLQELQERLAR